MDAAAAGDKLGEPGPGPIQRSTHAYMSTPEGNRGSMPLEHRRQATIDLLCEHFAEDRLTVEEFERRVDDVHQAASQADLDALLSDLPAPRTAATRASGVPATAGAHDLADPSRVKDRGVVVAILGGTGRKGRWSPARQNLVVSIMGGAELDFREAVMPPGVTELQIYTMWGGVDVIVPPGMHVESHGLAIMGGFEHAADEAVAPDPRRPTLRITGIALMAGVDISVRLPGESARDARKRKRLERRDRKRLEDGL